MSMSVALTLNEQKRKKNKVFRAFFIFLVLILFIIALFVFFFINSKFKSVESALVRVVANTASDFDSKISSNINVLNVLANLVTDDSDLATLENVKSLLTGIRRSHKFRTVSYLYDNATGYTYDYNSKNLSAADFNFSRCFWVAHEGNFCYALNLVNKSEEFYVPVKSSDNKLVGVIRGEILNSDLFKYFEKIPEKYKFNIYLVDLYGSITLMKRNTELPDVSNIFDLNYPSLKSVDDSMFTQSNSANVDAKWIIDSDLERLFIAIKRLKYGDYRVILIYPAISAVDNISVQPAVSGDSFNLNTHIKNSTIIKI